MRTVYGQIATEYNIAYTEEPTREGERRIRAWELRPERIGNTQPAWIPVDREHDQHPVGQVIHVERRDGNVWVVAELDDDVREETFVRVGVELRSVATPLYFSGVWTNLDGPVVLESVALTRSPARLAARPVRFLDGDAHLAAHTTSGPRFERDLLHRAADTRLRRHRGPIVIAGDRPMRMGYEYRNAAPGPIECRHATLGTVNQARREIDVIAVPYNEWTPVPYAGRIVEESIAPGAFNTVANRAHKYLVNMEHDTSDWIGNTVELRPDDPAGLRAKLKIRSGHGDLGNHFDQVLEDAAGGFLAASVGMAVAPSDQTWDATRSRRRVNVAFLDHIALTNQPAYPGAKVLAVRHA